MKKYFLITIMLLGTLSNTLYAQADTGKKVIYKWNENGLINYSHIKPLHIKNPTKLDAEGRAIEEFTEEFDEIISISVRPNAVAKKEEKVTSSSTESTESVEEPSKDVKQKRQADQKRANCQIAKRNMETLQGGEVYEKDEAGNMIRLKPDELEAKRKNVEKDVDYFCAE